MTIRSTIIEQMQSVARDQGKPLAALSDELPLLQSGLDSLGIATLIARLEDELGLDPFGTGDEMATPVTVGDLIGLYENAAHQSGR
jgi:acyl carrier protein